MRWLVEDPARLRATLLRVVAVSILLAAGTAIVALLGGSVDETEWRVVATSLGFAILSSTAAAGAALIRDRQGAVTRVGLVAVALSAVTFALLAFCLWAGVSVLDAGDPWRALGVGALLTLAASHASIVLRAGRPDDADAVRMLSAMSIALAVFECVTAALIVARAIRPYDLPDFDRVSAIAVVALLTSTALPPVLRRIAGSEPPADAHDETMGQRRVGGAAVTFALVSVVAIVAYAMGRASSAPEVRTVTAPPVTTAPEPVNYGTNDPEQLPQPIAIHMLDWVTPSGPFACSSTRGRSETRTGPGAGTGLETITLTRGPEGLCATMRSHDSAGFFPVRLAFHRAGRPNYAITLVPSERDLAFRLTLWPGDGSSTRVTFGNVGADAATASILVVSPRLPPWVLERATSWDARVE